MKRISLILFIFLSFLQLSRSQGVIDQQVKTLFSDERTFGVFLNSNGYGADYNYSKYIDAKNYWFYDIRLDYYKDPKEYRSMIIYQYYTRRFVYGKENLFWELKGSLGRQKELFSKYDYSAISIRLKYSAGLSLGFQKPIYYEINTYNNAGQPINVDEQKFDPGIHYANYGGTAPFTMGFNELKVIPGLNLKGGLCFEYSEKEPLVHAIEAGIGLTLYPKRIEIMATEKADFFFFRMYVGYRFGSILDISDIARSKSAKERRKERKEAAGPPVLNF